MATILKDVEKKTSSLVDEAEEALKKGRGWKFWVFTPIVLATIAACTYYGVRRFFAGSEQ